jgi:hypothetical protein
MAKNPRPATHRCGYVPWQRLMRQLGIDVETHLGLPTEEAPMAPARGPPFWQSRVLRRRYGERPDAAQA